MKKQSTSQSLALLLSFWWGIGFIPAALADIYSDVANIAINSSSINDMTKDLMPYMETVNQYTKEFNQLSKDEWAALTKMYNMSRQLDNAVPTEMWTADDWNSALSTASGGNSARYNELKTAYARQNPTMTSATSNQPINVDDLVENTYEQKSAVANTALASSQYTYEDVNHRIDTFNQLKAMIDSDTPNEKASIDLMARVLVEIGYIQTEMLRQQSVHTQLIATNAQEEINGQTGSKNFFSQTNQ